MKIKNLIQAKQFLYQQVPRGVKQRFPGSLGLERTKHFLKLLGNPQNKTKIIHVNSPRIGGSGALSLYDRIDDMIKHCHTRWRSSLNMTTFSFFHPGAFYHQFLPPFTSDNYSLDVVCSMFYVLCSIS